jgi:hypothetical protein
MAKGDAERELVVGRRTRFKTLDDLVARCGGRVAAALWETCGWARFAVGDYRFVIFSVLPDEKTDLYIQFWSEPEEPVVCEVCSGHWNAGAIKFIREPQRRAIEALGYSPGGRAGNFRKERPILTIEEAESAAREVLTIFFHVFGYRGQWPFTGSQHRGTRAAEQPVYESLTPEDFHKFAMRAGYRVQ